MNFIKKYKLLIIVTLLVICFAFFRDLEIISLMRERNVDKIKKGDLTKIIYYSLLFGALICRWCVILNENFMPFKKNKFN